MVMEIATYDYKLGKHGHILIVWMTKLNDQKHRDNKCEN